MRRGQDESTISQKAHNSLAGIVHKIRVENFLCHDSLEVEFNQHVNFIIGKNGSGKSAILTGIVVALGERASATSRGQSMKDFIKTGRSCAVVRVTLLNKGPGAYQYDVYGDYITIERTINASGGGGYKIMNESGRVVSSKRDELNRILAKMNLQVDNPVCILNQETAKNFLHSSDPKHKFKLFERATQMDIMDRDFSIAEGELSHAKSCLKEKVESLDGLKGEVKKWKERNEWYEAIDAVHELRSRLENEIAWAQVEGYEKDAATAQENIVEQNKNLEKLIGKKEDIQNSIALLQDKYRKNGEAMAERAQEINNVRSSQGNSEEDQLRLKNRLRQLLQEMKQLENDSRRFTKEKEDLLKAIRDLRQNDDSEYQTRKEKRLRELQDLKQRQEQLQAIRKVSENQVEQQKSALEKFKQEAQAARNELSRLQKEIDPRTRTITELRKSGANHLSVFGDWVPVLLERIGRLPFDAKPIGPLGAYIKVRDKSWAPAVEQVLSGCLATFICSTDQDSKKLNQLLDELITRGRRPTVITNRFIGSMHDVREHKVHVNQDMINKDIHCLFDMLIIEHPDVANVLIDMSSIESTLLFGDEGDARYMLSDECRVPRNCRSAFTKGGNTYYPDPNYRSYSGRVQKSARFIQVSVEDTIRVLEEEIDSLRHEHNCCRQNLERISGIIQKNECEFRTEETKLSATRREASLIIEKIRVVESQQEPEPADVLVFEEDLMDTEAKLEKVQSELGERTLAMDEAKRELAEMKNNYDEIHKRIASLASGCEPIKDVMKQIEAKQNELRETVGKLCRKEEMMRAKVKEFEDEYKTAKDKADAETANAIRFCPRVPVTKTLRALKSELKQITDQIANQEKEFGSREYVFKEYKRHKTEYDRGRVEVSNAATSLKKMNTMKHQRKEFIKKFRESVMIRTHYVFQALLKTRNYEGELRFDPLEKTLILMVTPPGRNDSHDEPPSQKRSRRSSASAATTDIRTLSGGERSFATVCFIIALWDAIESPFRVLDEFDVFMDHVNRRISMDLLIGEANANSRCQYIFLTPLGLELENQPNLFIFKMADPDRSIQAGSQP